jgi:hypothetical protein
MGVGGVETAAVYLSPQAITPLSASKEPIALALAARTDLSELAAAEAAKAASDKTVKAIGAADKSGLGNTQDKQRTVTQPEQSTRGVASAGRVDVYA